MIEIENQKLHDYIVLKDDLVTEGRKMTADIEKVEKDIKKYEDKEKAITAKIDANSEDVAAGNILAQQIDDMIKELDKIAERVEKTKLDAIPKDIKDAHLALLKQKESMERERNKIALKVQKIKDKVVPLVQKLIKPLLQKEYDDIETAKVKNGKVFITTFNHLDDWKAKFKR